jgi:myo-inositol-1(or 4)-monophosphatase
MDSFEAVARQAVAEAGDRLRAVWRDTKVVHHKGPVDLVTETDRELEALVVGHLRRAFPAHRIIAEEASAEEGSTGAAAVAPDDYIWYLDPLDGTTNFVHSFPHFAVSLGLARGRELVFGIVHDPIRDETFVASRGNGATLNGQPIHVSTVADLGHALIGTGFPYDRRTHADYYLGFVDDMMRRAQGIRRGGSAALDFCYVACGRLDGVWEFKLSPWDIAAGALIIHEAGGTVSDFRGAPLDLHGKQTAASNGAIHAAMVQVLTTRLDGAPHTN